MVRAALGGGPSSQDGMKLGCQQVSGMQGLILTVLINAISWFSSVGPRCGARDGVSAWAEESPRSTLSLPPPLLWCLLVL